jgi:ATP-binding cassette subfamily B protein/subfamily B ATP-binding cassette protein MsbA
MRNLNKFTFGVKRYFFLIAFVSIISMVISLITPKLYKIFVDEVIIGKKIRIFAFVALGYLLFYGVDTLLAFLRNYSNNRLLNRVMFRIKHRMLSNYLLFPFKEYEKRSIGDLKMRIDEDVEKLSAFSGAQTIDYVKAVITAIVSAVLILKIEWRLGAFSIIVIPLTFYINHKISLKEKKLLEINRGNDQSWKSWLHASVQGWKEIKALNLQKHQLRTFVRYTHNLAEFNGRWINYWVIRVLVVPKIKDEFLMRFALYFFGGLLIMGGSLTIGQLLVFAMYYDLLSKSIQTVSFTDAELQSNMPFYDRVIDELNTANRASSKKLQAKNAVSDIYLKNIQFSYSKSLPLVLHNFSLEVKQGERVAIVGRSGSGKSTILKLITGMLNPNSGQVLFSGIDINEINPNFLYGKMGFVLQENLLFNATISENLKLACPKADISMLDEACKKACIYDFIYAQPEGYGTVIGEKGLKLSGGQRQRLILARLFLRDVDVMIFDEATSAVDQYSESIIHDAINGIGRDKTIIVVAHRDSSIALCDRVIRLT